MNSKFEELEKKLESNQLAIDKIIQLETEFAALKEEASSHTKKINALTEQLRIANANVKALQPFAQVAADDQTYRATLNSQFDTLFEELRIASQLPRPLREALAEAAADFDQRIQFRLEQESIRDLVLMKWSDARYVKENAESLRSRGAILSVSALCHRVETLTPADSKEIEWLEVQIKQLMDDFKKQTLPTDVVSDLYRLLDPSVIDGLVEGDPAKKKEKGKLIQEMRKGMVSAYFARKLSPSACVQLDGLFKDALDKFRGLNKYELQPFLNQTNTELLANFKSGQPMSPAFSDLIRLISQDVDLNLERITLSTSQEQVIYAALRKDLTMIQGIYPLVERFWAERIEQLKQKINLPLQAEIAQLKSQVEQLKEDLSRLKPTPPPVTHHSTPTVSPFFSPSQN